MLQVPYIRNHKEEVITKLAVKNFDAVDIRQSIAAAVSVKVIEPVFESQTKTKLGSNEIGPGMTTIRTFINDFVKVQLDNYLHKNPETADGLLKKILESEKEAN